MLKIILIAAALMVPMAPSFGQSGGTPAGGGTLPLDELEAGDGTLPLRLPGDGTLPLRLSGDAVSQPTEARVDTNVTINSADRRALPVPQRGSLECQLNSDRVSKHAATGTVVISGSTYQIKGICYDHSNKNMEIVSSRGQAEKSFMIGPLQNPEPSTFAGSLIISGATTSRYRFDVRSLAQ